MQIAFPIFIFLIIFCYQASSSAVPDSGTRFKRGASIVRSGSDWSYHGENGPQTWCTNYPDCCGLLQSPINLLADNTTYVPFDPFDFIDYDVPINVVLTNTGHTVSLGVESDSIVPRVTGGHFVDVYQLENIHFHWGHDSSLGSEHQLDGKTFPLESHLVHFNTKYANFSVASNHVDGLAVFAVFYEIQNQDNEYLESIVDEFKNIPFLEDIIQVPEKIVLRDLLPQDLSQFYRYNGSLTTPPCSEVVTWTVFDDPLGVSEAQMNEFREDFHETSEKEEGCTDDVLHDNHRDPQDGHDRLVEHNVNKLRYTFKNYPLQFLTNRIRAHRFN